MTLPNPRLVVKKDKATKEPPPDWCLPTFHQAIVELEEKWGKTPLRSKCAHEDDCPETPEDLRAAAEAELRKLGAVPPAYVLPLDVYTAGRNLRSEFSDGTPEEKAAIILAGINRAREEGATTLTEHLIHRTKKNYGRQIGTTRPASTAQDPTVADVLIAQMIFSGLETGEITDITHGATHYLDRVSQDFMRQKSIAANAENPEVELVPSGEDVYLSWTEGGDYLTWVGHIPNVRPTRLFLFRRMRELRPDTDDAADLKRKKVKLRAEIREAGLKAIRGTNRAPAPWDSCAEDADAAAALRAGVMVGGATLAFGAAIGLAVGVIASRTPTIRRPRRA